MYLIEGLFLGLASIIFIGPVVFELINASLVKAKYGISVALGIILGDIIYVFAVYNSLRFFVENQSFNIILAYAGFGLLSVMGLLYFLKKPPKHKHKSHHQTAQINASTISYFLRGFSINFFNPFVLSVWLMVVNYAESKHASNVVSFLIAALLGIFIIDLFKVYLSKYLSIFINSKKILIFYKISGIVMIGFALRILYFLMF